MRKRTSGWLAAALLLAVPAHAGTFKDDTFFTASDRSIWASGAGFTYDSGQRFLGTAWNLDASIGGIDETCVFSVCASFGAEVGAKTSGKVGIDYSLKVNSGAFDVQLPGRATFTVPDTTPGAKVGAITVGSSFVNLAGGLPVPTSPNGPSVVRLPSLQVTGPNAQASLGIEAKVDGFAGAKACVVVCYGPALGPLGFDYTKSIATVNINNDHQVTVLGNTVSANQSVSALNGLLNASFTIPNLDSSSQTTPNGFNGSTLTSAKRDNIATVNANLAQIAADATGFPFPLSGNIGPFGYNLLQANAGAALDVQQTVTVTPKVAGTYLFSSPVIPVINGVDGAATDLINFAFGDDVTFKPGAVGKISYIPFINLDGIVHNETDLVVGGNVDIKALGVNVAGLTLGPLINTALASTDIGRLSLFNQTFTDRIGSITASPITLDFAGCTTPVRLGTGDVSPIVNFICSSSDFNSVGDYQNPDGSFYHRISFDQCPAVQVGSVPACVSVADLAHTSPVELGLFRQTYLRGADSLTYRPIDTTPSTTDAGQLIALASLGYTGPPLGNAPDFLIPTGASLESFDVDEPPALALLALPLLAALTLTPTRGKLQTRF